jgi:hypothetical protein
MNDWTYHTPSKEGEVGPGYKLEMECEYTLRGRNNWETNGGPSWDPAFTYRYRWPTAKPVEEVPDWIARRYLELMRGADPTGADYRSGSADVVREAVCAWIAAHEPKPDPLTRIMRTMFEVGNAPRNGEDLANAVQYARDHADALIAALKGDTE